MPKIVDIKFVTGRPEMIIEKEGEKRAQVQWTLLWAYKRERETGMGSLRDSSTFEKWLTGFLEHSSDLCKVFNEPNREIVIRQLRDAGFLNSTASAARRSLVESGTIDEEEVEISLEKWINSYLELGYEIKGEVVHNEGTWTQTMVKYEEIAHKRKAHHRPHRNVFG